uniref:Uncharacterized protein n=1 Tax=Physcomitrium patens TaxID=3218 RepID=A0A7I3ZHB5_PHYPA
MNHHNTDKFRLPFPHRTVAMVSQMSTCLPPSIGQTPCSHPSTSTLSSMDLEDEQSQRFKMRDAADTLLMIITQLLLSTWRLVSKSGMSTAVQTVISSPVNTSITRVFFFSTSSVARK